MQEIYYNDKYKARGSEDEKQALVFYRVEVINTSFVVHGDDASGEGSVGSIHFLHNFAPAKRLTTLLLRRYASHL